MADNPVQIEVDEHRAAGWARVLRRFRLKGMALAVGEVAALYAVTTPSVRMWLTLSLVLLAASQIVIEGGVFYTTKAERLLKIGMAEDEAELKKLYAAAEVWMNFGSWALSAAIFMLFAAFLAGIQHIG